MFTETLSDNTKKALELLGKSGLMKDAYLADLKDIAAMKIDAIGSRGIKRDFIDLFFICQSGIKLESILDLYDQKYGKLASNLIHIQRSLVYFVDADAGEMPKMIKKVDWAKVKTFFESAVKKIN